MPRDMEDVNCLKDGNRPIKEDVKMTGHEMRKWAYPVCDSWIETKSMHLVAGIGGRLEQYVFVYNLVSIC